LTSSELGGLCFEALLIRTTPSPRREADGKRRKEKRERSVLIFSPM
jgi:hypothetical protein